MDRAAFGRDERTQDAVVRCLEILSEASRRVPEPVRARHPGIPWSRIAGIGNILRHEYRSVSPDIVWRVTRENLPELKDACLAIRKELRRAKPV
ncbi:MAG: DUF86 domain-containing protein [Tagaea sp.]|nr:DUF86 domain-containing protein [Tagaea sp.]